MRLTRRGFLGSLVAAAVLNIAPLFGARGAERIVFAALPARQPKILMMLGPGFDEERARAAILRGDTIKMDHRPGCEGWVPTTTVANVTEVEFTRWNEQGTLPEFAVTDHLNYETN